MTQNTAGNNNLIGGSHEQNNSLKEILAYMFDIGNIVTDIGYQDERMDSTSDYDYSACEQVNEYEREGLERDPDMLNPFCIEIEGVETAVKYPGENRQEKFPCKLTIMYNEHSKMITVHKDFSGSKSPLRTRTEKYSSDGKSVKRINYYGVIDKQHKRDSGEITDLGQITKRIYGIQKLAVQFYDDFQNKLTIEKKRITGELGDGLSA